ncbi:Replication initiation protein [Vibrio crassostreae]|uniref:replication initiation protein n=1 Tax=Vibrio splendidus TaxID=29497 RepID=UPI002469B8A0|nr:replication initiation protein [Vibrio splendidus]CAK2443518.1 Replication initiation protein [Vibrio crassostreae]MDH5935590.1 replication initiation protein [Vibrio splendidus]CAK2806132.1 Replication initiation protein [Vibrio crassostreae]CAK3290188.1 Replication initiation protein [Vibrio crassostreae]CAK3848103.1 Replication initiation protein [Vibrio crassostreae]
MDSKVTTSKKHTLPKQFKKAHKLVFSQQDLTQREADLFALMIAHMKPEDWENNNTPTYQFTSTQLSRWLNIDPKELAKTLRPVADRLTKKNIGVMIEDDTKDIQEFDFISIFKRVTYKDRRLTMKPNEELKDAYIEYNNSYALITTQSFLSLKKEYAKRLYEILSRFKGGGTYLQTFDIEDLKGLFGLHDPAGKIKSGKRSFSNNSVFIDRCIKASIKGIEDDSETNQEIMFFDSEDGRTHGYEVYREGRKISKIKFLYRWVEKKGPVQKLNLDDIKRIISSLEMKRIGGSELTTDELKNLAHCYTSIGEQDRASKINMAIKRREKEEEQRVEMAQSIESFLNEINNLSVDDNY